MLWHRRSRYRSQIEERKPQQVQLLCPVWHCACHDVASMSDARCLLSLTHRWALGIRLISKQATAATSYLVAGEIVKWYKGPAILFCFNLHPVFQPGSRSLLRCTGVNHRMSILCRRPMIGVSLIDCHCFPVFAKAVHPRYILSEERRYPLYRLLNLTSIAASREHLAVAIDYFGTGCLHTRKPHFWQCDTNLPQLFLMHLWSEFKYVNLRANGFLQLRRPSSWIKSF